jgi:SM-20-related protein
MTAADLEGHPGEHLLGALGAARLAGSPWPHAYLEDTLPPAFAAALADTFDGFELERCVQTEQEKTYRFGTSQLDAMAPDDLPGTQWAQLVGLLGGQEYRDALSKLCGVPLDGAEFTLSVWEYRGGDWLAPHVDKADKLVTQIFYLTRDWQPGGGGRLLILDVQHGPEVHAYPPHAGSSAVLVRSERSWHAVERSAPTSGPRLSVTATYWRPGGSGPGHNSEQMEVTGVGA